MKLGSLYLDSKWKDGHDEIKYAIGRALEDLGIGFTAEAHGIFTPCVPPGAQAAARRFMQRDGGRDAGMRQGLIPDLKIDLPTLVDGAASTAALAELKTLHCGRTPANPIGGTTYPTAGDKDVFQGRRRAVLQRATKIQPEREIDARKSTRDFAAQRAALTALCSAGCVRSDPSSILLLATSASGATGSNGCLQQR